MPLLFNPCTMVSVQGASKPKRNIISVETVLRLPIGLVTTEMLKHWNNCCIHNARTKYEILLDEPPCFMPRAVGTLIVVLCSWIIMTKRTASRNVTVSHLTASLPVQQRHRSEHSRCAPRGNQPVNSKMEGPSPAIHCLENPKNHHVHSFPTGRM